MKELSNETELITLETIFNEAKEKELPVCLDPKGKRLIFVAKKDQYPAIFSFMDEKKVKNERGYMVYPITFAIYPASR